MARRILSTFTILLAAYGAVALAHQAPLDSAQGRPDRAADARAIRHEIERIFQAFIDKDRQALIDTHAQNWRGFQANSRSVIKGLDGYVATSVGTGPMGPKGQGM